jgi:hypothetical protein
LKRSERKIKGVKKQACYEKRKGVRAQWTPYQIQHVDPKHLNGEDFGMTTYREINFLPSRQEQNNRCAKKHYRLSHKTLSNNQK